MTKMDITKGVGSCINIDEYEAKDVIVGLEYSPNADEVYVRWF